MAYKGTYSSYIELTSYSQAIVDAVRLGMNAAGPKTVRQPAALNFIIGHYWDLVMEHGNKELVAALRKHVKVPEMRKSPQPVGLPAGDKPQIRETNP